MAKDEQFTTLELPVEQFRTPPAAAPIPQGPLPANPATIPGMTGQLPWPVAQVIKPEFMTELEQATLKQYDWKPGDPIPADMAQRLSGEVDQVRREAANLAPPVSLNTPAMPIPPEVPLSTLPPAKQAEIRAALAQAKVLEEQSAQSADNNAGVGSQLNVGQEIDLIDDTKPRAAAPQVAAADQTGAAAVTTLAHCPHCNWDLTIRDIPEPDDETKLWYMQAVLGIIPFEKTFPLFNGAAAVTFRELKFYELEGIYQQVRTEIRRQEVDENTLATEGDFKEAVNRYRVAMQMVKILLGKEGKTIPNRNPDGSPVNLPAVRDAVHALLNNTSLYRVVRLEMIKFNRLVARLEAAAADENFYKAASKT